MLAEGELTIGEHYMSPSRRGIAAILESDFGTSYSPTVSDSPCKISDPDLPAPPSDAPSRMHQRSEHGKTASWSPLTTFIYVHTMLITENFRYNCVQKSVKDQPTMNSEREAL